MALYRPACGLLKCRPISIDRSAPPTGNWKQFSQPVRGCDEQRTRSCACPRKRRSSPHTLAAWALVQWRQCCRLSRLRRWQQSRLAPRCRRRRSLRVECAHARVCCAVWQAHAWLTRCEQVCATRQQGRRPACGVVQEASARGGGGAPPARRWCALRGLATRRQGLSRQVSCSLTRCLSYAGDGTAHLAHVEAGEPGVVRLSLHAPLLL